MSTDTHETQCAFAESVGAPFPMIGDADRAIGKAYGVLWPLLGVSQRVTFVVDREGVIRGVFHHEIQATKHIDDALALLERLTPG